MDRYKRLYGGFSVVGCNTLFMTPTCLGKLKCISSINSDMYPNPEPICDIASTTLIQAYLTKPLTSVSHLGGRMGMGHMSVTGFEMICEKKISLAIALLIYLHSKW